MSTHRHYGEYKSRNSELKAALDSLVNRLILPISGRNERPIRPVKEPASCAEATSNPNLTEL